MKEQTEKYKKRMKAVCDSYKMEVECIVPKCNGKPRLHHIVPRNKGGTDAIVNLMPICAKHEGCVHTTKAKIRRYNELHNIINP